MEKAGQIKERNIAVEVFGKPENYDPQEASTVRVAAGDVRKRLVQAYLSDLGDGIWIELPVGSYCPRFRLQKQVAAETASGQESVPEPIDLESVPAAFVASKPATDLNTGKSFWKHAALFALAVVAMLVTVVAVQKGRRDPFDDVWKPFVSRKHTVLVVLPTPLVLEARHPDRWSSGTQVNSLAEELNPRGGSYTGVGASLGAARVAEQLAKRDQSFILRFGKDTSYADVSQSPAVLFGGTSSRLGVQIASSLPFQIEDGTQSSSIVDSRASDHRRWSMPKNVPTVGKQEGYVLLTLLRRTPSRLPVLIVAGLSPSDTLAGSLFITDDEAVALFAKTANLQKKDGNLQIVLHEWIYDGSPEKPTAVAWAEW